MLIPQYLIIVAMLSIAFIPQFYMKQIGTILLFIHPMHPDTEILSGISVSENVEMDEGAIEVLQAIKATKTSDTYKIAPEKEQVAPKQKNPEFEN